MFRPTTIAVVLFITTGINLIAFYISWRRRKNAGGSYFALGLLAVVGWTLAAAFDYAAVAIPLKVFFAQLEYTFYNLALALMAVFVLSYAGYEDWLQKKWLVLLLCILPAANILLAWTNAFHHVLWSSFTPSAFGDNTLIFHHGPAFIWAALFSYVLVLVIVIPLWQAARGGSDLSRRQARLLLLSIFLPLLANLVYLFESPQFQGVDWTSLTFSITGVLFVLALYGTRLLDLVPIARDKLVNSLSDGMIILDLQNRVIDINQAATQMLGTDSEIFIGHDLVSAAPSLAAAVAAKSAEEELKIEVGPGAGSPYTLELMLSPLRDSRQTVVGRLILFRDITERKQIESERAAWAAVLQATFDSSSAGILVLDNNGQTILANKQFAKIWPVAEMEPVAESSLPFFSVVRPYVNNFNSLTEFVEGLRRDPTQEGFIRLLLSDERIFDVRTAPYYTGQAITGQVWTFENVTKRIGAEKAEVLVEERRRISQEAHDGLLQGLVGLRLQLNQWHKTLDQDPPRLHGRIDELQTFVADSIDEMRRFIFALRPAPLETGFFNAVRQLATGMQRYYQLSVSVESIGPEMRLHQDWEQALFRVVQESLSNIGKHAHASQAWVQIDLSDPQTLVVTVRDNGRGFDSSATPAPLHGFGLGNMADRIKSLGGQLSIESQPGLGTQVRASIPYNAQH